MEQREQRIAAENHHARSVGKVGQELCRSRPRRGGLGDALRQPLDPSRDRGAHGARLRSLAGGAALSAIFSRDVGDRLRRGLPRAGRDARATGVAGVAALLRRSRLYRGARRLDQWASCDAAVQAGIDRGIVSRHAEGVCRQGRSVPGAVHRDHERPAQAPGARCLEAAAHLPVAVRQRGVAPALYRQDHRAIGEGWRPPHRRGDAGLCRRLPGNAGRDRAGKCGHLQAQWRRSLRRGPVS